MDLLASSTNPAATQATIRGYQMYSAAIALLHLQKFYILKDAAKFADKSLAPGEAQDKFAAQSKLVIAF